MAITEWCSPDDLQNAASPLAPSAVRVASRILYALTGRIYAGEKTVTETYLPAMAAADPLLTYTLAQYGIGTIHGMSPMRVGLSGQIRIPLRRRPVTQILSVQTAVPNQVPTIIAPASYELTQSTYLTLLPTAPVLVGLTVEYSYGQDPPPDGVDAAVSLADELIMLFSGVEDSQDTRLKGVTSFTRNGVAIEIEDARTILTDGRTGIPQVDLFVASVNPTRAKMRSRVVSPDAHFRL